MFSAHRYGIDAMGAMAQGLFASLLIGTIIKTLGEQIGLQFWWMPVLSPRAWPGLPWRFHRLRPAHPAAGAVQPDCCGQCCQQPGRCRRPPGRILYRHCFGRVRQACQQRDQVDIIVTPAVTILVGTGLSVLFAPAIGAAASAVGSVIMWATELQPLLMGILVSVLVGIALTLPISSAAICAALNLTGLAGGAAVAAAAPRWSLCRDEL